MDGSNADLALHMEGTHADFVPYIEGRHHFGDQKIDQIAFPAKNFKELVLTTYIQRVYMIYLNTFENKNKRESTFKQ